MTTSVSEVFDFEIDKGVIDNVNFLNEILDDLNAGPVTENPDFVLDKNSSGKFGINIWGRSLKGENSAEMWIEVGSDHIRLDLDGINETFEWANSKKSREEVADFIRHIFTGHILIETRRSSRFIQIFASDGSLFHSSSHNNLLHMLTGLYLWRRKTFRRLFSPFISD